MKTNLSTVINVATKTLKKQKPLDIMSAISKGKGIKKRKNLFLCYPIDHYQISTLYIFPKNISHILEGCL